MVELAEIAGDLAQILQRARRAGQRFVYLTPESRDALFAEPRSARRIAPVHASAVEAVKAPAPATVREDDHVPVQRAAASRRAAVTDVSGLDLASLQARAAECTACALHAQRTRTVFGGGATPARLMFIGEGPGYEEDRQGLPFVGPAGHLLDEMIAAMQFERDAVYIANIVKCRPPRNRSPHDTEAAACRPFLERQIELVQPEVIVLLGATPLKFLLGKKSINREHGQWCEYQGIPVLPTFHPAYLLRLPQRKREAWVDLQKVMRRLGKDPAATPRRRRS